MPLNDIDELIKKGLKESEMRQEIHLLQAKPRIWDAIQKPKEQTRIHWFRITTLAATLSLFLIATSLFLKLESKEKELEALKAEVNTQVLLPEKDKPITSEAPKTNTMEESNTIVQSTVTKDQKMDTSLGIKIEPIELNKPDHIIPLEIGKIEPNINFSQLITQDVESILAIEKEEEMVLNPTKEKMRKLKLKIGNGNSGNAGQQNTLAFNIKL